MKRRNLLILSCILGACSGGDPAQPTYSNPPGTGGNLNPQQSANVSMRSQDDGSGYGSTTHSFSPATVTVVRGGAVTWTNSSDVVHNVLFASATGAPANIPNLPSGSATRVFTTAGSFNYQCGHHQGMAGVVTVQ